jgi:hypothetical protein
MMGVPGDGGANIGAQPGLLRNPGDQSMAEDSAAAYVAPDYSRANELYATEPDGSDGGLSELEPEPVSEWIQYIREQPFALIPPTPTLGMAQLMELPAKGSLGDICEVQGDLFEYVDSKSASGLSLGMPSWEPCDGKKPWERALTPGPPYAQCDRLQILTPAVPCAEMFKMVAFELLLLCLVPQAHDPEEPPPPPGSFFGGGGGGGGGANFYGEDK